MLDEFFIEGKGELLDALKELYWLSSSAPSQIITVILKACQKQNHSSIPLGLAVLMSRATSVFIQANRNMLISILMKLDAEEVMSTVEYLKNKDFGRGLGSNVQKIFRDVMERWDVEEVERYVQLYPKELYRMVRLIHPRYTDSRGRIVKALIRNQTILKILPH